MKNSWFDWNFIRIYISLKTLNRTMYFYCLNVVSVRQYRFSDLFGILIVIHSSDFSNCALTDKFEHISLFSCYIWSIVDIGGVQCQYWLHLRLKNILMGEHFYTISKKNYNLRAVLISYTGLAIRIFGAIRMKNIKITTVLCIDLTISNNFHTEDVENSTELKCKNG